MSRQSVNRRSVKAKGQILVGGVTPPVVRRPWTRGRIVRLATGVVVLLAGAGWAWAYGVPETWVEISRVRPLTVGDPQQVSVALRYRPPFLVPSQARSIPGTIQLISFGQRVEVTPTTLVTTARAPSAVFTVTGKSAGLDELIFAGSDSPKDSRSWRTMSTKVSVVTKP